MHELAITESVVAAVTEQVGTAKVIRVLDEDVIEFVRSEFANAAARA